MDKQLGNDMHGILLQQMNKLILVFDCCFDNELAITHPTKCIYFIFIK